MTVKKVNLAEISCSRRCRSAQKHERTSITLSLSSNRFLAAPNSTGGFCEFGKAAVVPHSNAAAISFPAVGDFQRLLQRKKSSRVSDGISPCCPLVEDLHTRAGSPPTAAPIAAPFSASGQPHNSGRGRPPRWSLQLRFREKRRTFHVAADPRL